MIKYVCDNCGVEVKSDNDLTPLGFNETRVSTEGIEYGTSMYGNTTTQFVKVGEYCKACREKIEARIKKGMK